MTANELIGALRTGDAAGIAAALATTPDLGRSRDENGVSVLCLAVYFGRDELARQLARGRTDLDIFEASAIGDAARVAAIATAAPDSIDAYSPDGFHPLGYACFFGRREVFDVLLRAGANVEAAARNAMQVRPLHSAVAHSDADVALELARRLLAAGASPNATQQSGFTPLHEAALRGHAQLVRELLRHGADPEARNGEGKKPLDLARQNDRDEVVALLGSRSTESLMILIAGPYRSGTGDVSEKMAANVRTMEAYALPLFRAGHIPVVGEWLALPLVELAGSRRVGDEAFDEIFHPIAERLLAKCDGVLRVGGASQGADLMVATARRLGLRVFRALAEVPGCAALP